MTLTTPSATHSLLSYRQVGPMIRAICGSENAAYLVEVHHTKAVIR